MEDADRVFDGSLSGYSLDRLDDDLLSLHIGVELSLIHDLVDIACRVHLGFVLHALHEAFLSFLGREAGEFLQFGALLILHLFELSLTLSDDLLLVVDAHLPLFHLLFAALEFLLTLVKGDLALFQAVLVLLDLLVAQLHFLLQLAFFIQELLLDLKELFLFDHVCILLSSLQDLVIFTFRDMAEVVKSGQRTQCQGNDGSNDDTYHVLLIV